MSAPNTPSGPNSTTPTPGAPPVIRKSRPSAFMQKKKPIKKRVPQPGQKPASTTQSNGAAASQQTGNIAPSGAEDDPNFSEYPIFVTKGDLLQGLRHHVIKFLPKQDNQTLANIEVNPFDESQFTRPVHLHRRLARDKAIQQRQEEEELPGVDDKEREMMLAKKADKEAQREADKAQIAPGGSEPKPAKRKNEKKFQYSNYIDAVNDPVRAKRAKLRHEEARQWHLEDFDRKNTWVGSYEEPLSEQSAMFVVENNGFRMVPLERWYKFIPTNKVQAMPIEHAEKYYKERFKPDRWFMKTQQANEDAIKKALQSQQQPGTQQRQKRPADDENGGVFANAGGATFRGDVDEIDFEFDGEFQDDDEGMIFGDTAEEAKETYDRIRQEQREANLPSTGIKEEDRDWDMEEEMEKQQEKDERRRARKMRKALKKKEHKFEYDSDSDKSYFSLTESEDSDEEREREAKEKEEEARKQANGDKSGISTKGSNTPTGRAEKKAGANAGLGASLKRPGSPSLSDASGNESSRKKAKLANGSLRGDGRSLSPDAARGAGSGSDTESSSRQKIRLKTSPPGSRAGSPPASGASSPKRAPLTVEEIRNSIPDGGITTSGLIQKFASRMPPKLEFMAMVKKAANWNKETKKLTPKAEIEQ
ncbi:Rap30/74 interaction domain-containing protein [Polychaeton citri CBS 116435]|uniref:Rap30/74 interaction domain-containing protein n=1 Tax=Polychaeton citri CBS 116435 TaxID=1314669 RepID=A0A9P4QDQ4_9PEZI|nr:Rap30/74 interaction domain-containing protein [Polychaeton citri CBS 116435]